MIRARDSSAGRVSSASLLEQNTCVEFFDCPIGLLRPLNKKLILSPEIAMLDFTHKLHGKGAHGEPAFQCFPSMEFLIIIEFLISLGKKSRGKTDSKFVFLTMGSTSKIMTFHLSVVHGFGTVFCWWQLNKTENGGEKRHDF